MGMFLDLLYYILREPGANESGITCVLSPARSATSVVENQRSDIGVERLLIRTFERNNFEAWLQGDREEEGSVTVMG